MLQALLRLAVGLQPAAVMVKYDHKATSAAVEILLRSLFFLLCSLFPMYLQDSAERNREVHTAAQCTAFPSLNSMCDA